MKQLICEMCGGTDLVKKNGLFICQNCGVKYTLEEAKKLMSDCVAKTDTIVTKDDVVVKSDNVVRKKTAQSAEDDELKRLYMAARMAKETANAATGYKYYQEILAKDPMSWEANFYVVYFQALNSRLVDLNGAILSVLSCKKQVFKLIEKIKTKTEQKKAVNEVARRYSDIAGVFFEGIKAKNGAESSCSGRIVNVNAIAGNDVFFAEVRVVLDMLLDVVDECDKRNLSPNNGRTVCGKKGVEICENLSLGRLSRCEKNSLGSIKSYSHVFNYYLKRFEDLI